MLIPCPYCGLRSHEEFTTLGEAGRVRPSGDDLQAFADYVYLRNNVAGRHRELWFHAAGCHAWLTVERDTLTHLIHGAWPVNETPTSEAHTGNEPANEAPAP
jgi:sarcosine oxidase subunit delta